MATSTANGSQVTVMFKWGENFDLGEGWQIASINDADNVFTDLEDNAVFNLEYGPYTSDYDRRLTREMWAQGIVHDLIQHNHTEGEIHFDEVTAVTIAYLCFSNNGRYGGSYMPTFGGDLSTTIASAIANGLPNCSYPQYEIGEEAQEFLDNNWQDVQAGVRSELEPYDISWAKVNKPVLKKWLLHGIQAGYNFLEQFDGDRIDALRASLKRQIADYAIRLPEQPYGWGLTFDFAKPYQSATFIDGEDLYWERARTAQEEQYLEDLPDLLNEGNHLEMLAEYCSSHCLEDEDGINDEWFPTDDDGDFMVCSEGWQIALQSSSDLVSWVIKYLGNSDNKRDVYDLSLETEYEFYYEGE